VSNLWDKLDAEERAALAPLRKELEEISARHAGDPPLDVLRAAQAGILPEAAQQALARHLSQSAWSRELASELEGAAPDAAATERILARVLASANTKAKAEAATNWGRFWRPALALAAVGVAVVLLLQGPWEETAHLPPPSPAVETPARPLLPLEKPAITLPASVLAVRGESDAQQFLRDLRPALDAYRADNFADAARLLDALARKYPRSREVRFYLGVSRLFVDAPAAAMEALLAARRLEGPNPVPQTSWYLALAYQRTNAEEQFQSEMRALCDGKSEFAAKACAARGK
jgi:hypothetical protein